MPDTPEGRTLLEELTQTANHLTWLVKCLMLMAFVIAILVVGSLLRSVVVQHAADDATDAANSAGATSVQGRDAAIHAADELDAAIKRMEDRSDSGVNDQAVSDALQAIARIEGYLCGGTCPTTDDSQP